MAVQPSSVLGLTRSEAGSGAQPPESPDGRMPARKRQLNRSSHELNFKTAQAFKI